MKTPVLHAGLVVTLLCVAATSLAQSITQRWRSGLAGAKLTTYSGSAISANSTLTVLDFCRNGRYRYYKEGSWSVPGQAGGASNTTITGRWDVQQRGSKTLLVYKTDRGQRGAYPIYLQRNGRVNIGGAAYGVQAGGAGC